MNTKPVRLSAAATITLPRWGMLLLCLLYIIPGLVGRDPWKNNDVTGFGLMWTMAHGHWQDWLWPNIAGLASPSSGPLPFWLGALCIKLFGAILGDVTAARLSTIFFFFIASSALWNVTCYLGGRNEAQPIPLVFGGHPDVHEYERTLADGSLLIFLACFGLIPNIHETSLAPLYIALISWALYAGVRFLENSNFLTSITLSVPLGLMAITYNAVVPIFLWAGMIFIFSSQRPRSIQTLNYFFLAGILALTPTLLWLGSAVYLQPYGSSPLSGWIHWNLHSYGWPNIEAIQFFSKNGLWFFWPAWPFAFWALYAWRKQFNATHITLPAVQVALLTLLAWSSDRPNEFTLAPLLPPLVILASFGLPTIKRASINAIDWFAVMASTISAITIWLFWVAKETGYPKQLSKNVLKLAPGFKPEFQPLPFIIALLVTAAWCWLVYWRIVRKPSALWRAVVLSSGGIILCWVLLMTLWLPWGNFVKSYAGVALQIHAALPKQAHCVRSNVGDAQRASFAYFENIPFEKFGGDSSCNYYLLQDNASEPENQVLLHHFDVENWHLIWHGHRPSDRDERFRLYQRNSKP